jgi:hypothetical protein
MVIKQRQGWKYFACPVEGCDYMRAFKWQRTKKSEFRRKAYLEKAQ